MKKEIRTLWDAFSQENNEISYSKTVESDKQK